MIFGFKLNQCRVRTMCTHLAKKNEILEDVLKGPTIQWYPGHIAKAERELADYLKKVDVVIEVRDARIPLATTHPMVPSWVGSKPLIIAIARLDQISSKALTEWREYYAMNPAHPERPDAKVYFVDGKNGAGILTLKKQALKAGEAINEKRVRRGIQPRAVRAAVIGYPNVGKSALINRLLGRKMAKSRNLPGVTRQLQWIRIGGLEGNQENVIELLDSPGIIPAKQVHQPSAIKLAICNDIGEASYDRVVVAAEMCDHINKLSRNNKNYINMKKIIARYEMSFNRMTGDEIVYDIAEKLYQGNLISAADKLLGDFRKGYMGPSSLEAAPISKQQKIKLDGGLDDAELRRLKLLKRREERQQVNPSMRGNTNDNDDDSIHDTDDDSDIQEFDDDDDDNNNNDDDDDDDKERENTDKIILPKVNLDIGRGNYEGW